MTDVGREEFRALAARLDSIDATGTRGVAVLAVQLQEVAKDVTRVEAQMAQHAVDHAEEARRHVSARRWLIGAVIAVIGAIDGPLITVLLAVLSRSH